MLVDLLLPEEEIVDVRRQEAPRLGESRFQSFEESLAVLRSHEQILPLHFSQFDRFMLQPAQHDQCLSP